jgi:RecG-like helicase
VHNPKSLQYFSPNHPSRERLAFDELVFKNMYTIFELQKQQKQHQKHQIADINNIYNINNINSIDDGISNKNNILASHSVDVKLLHLDINNNINNNNINDNNVDNNNNKNDKNVNKIYIKKDKNIDSIEITSNTTTNTNTNINTNTNTNTNTSQYVAMQIALLKLLPFQLTSCQRRVTHEILQDLRRESRMIRLLQGDVVSDDNIYI